MCIYIFYFFFFFGGGGGSDVNSNSTSASPRHHKSTILALGFWQCSATAMWQSDLALLLLILKSMRKR